MTVDDKDQHFFVSSKNFQNENRANPSSREEESTRRPGNSSIPPTQKAPPVDGTTQTTSSLTRTNENESSEFNGGFHGKGVFTNTYSQFKAGSGSKQELLNRQGPTKSPYSPSTNFVGLGPEGYGNQWNMSNGYGSNYAPPPPMNGNFYGQQAGPQVMNGMSWQNLPQQASGPGWGPYPSHAAGFGASWSYRGHRRVLEKVYGSHTSPDGVVWYTVRFQNEPNLVAIPASELRQIQRENGEITHRHSDPLPPGYNTQQSFNGINTAGSVPPVQPYVQAPQIVFNIAPIRPQTTNGPILPATQRESRAPPKRTVFSPVRNRSRSKSRRSRSRARRNKKPPAPQKQSMNKIFSTNQGPKKPAPRSSSQVRSQPPAPKTPSTFVHDELFDLLAKTLEKKVESFNAQIASNGPDVVKQKAVLAKLTRLLTYVEQILEESSKVAKGRGQINVDFKEQPEDVQRLLARAPSYALNETKRIEASLLRLRRLYVESLLDDNKRKIVDRDSTAKHKKWYIDEVNKELMIQLKSVKENRFAHVLLQPVYPRKEKKQEGTKDEEDKQKDEKSGGDEEKKKEEDTSREHKCSHQSCAKSDNCLYQL